MTAALGWNGTLWTPEPDYSSDASDLASDFYGPAMGGADRYDRITGFFSSGAFLLYWPALRGFVERHGKIRLLCSPRLSPVDTENAGRGYAARDDAELASTLAGELDELLGRYELRKPALAFAGLVAAGIVEVKLARLEDAKDPGDRRMFHDKVGLFHDKVGNAIGFRGSANESYLGLSSARGNVESIDAWPSWAGDRDAKRVSNAVRRFDHLWAGQAHGIEVLSLPAGLQVVLQQATEGTDWREIVDELAAVKDRVATTQVTPTGRPLRKQQVTGIAAWEANGKRGILAHATGSGKTVTGITVIGQHVGPTIVIAPTELVATQWFAQLREELGPAGRRVHLCGAGNVDWKDKLSTWVTDTRTQRVIVAVAPTAASERFLSQVRTASELLVVGDEVHRLGAPSYAGLLQLDTPYRLGLSATPERAGDPEGTERLFDYFGGIVHRYSLEDAMRDGVLCNYLYHPQTVRLDDQEQQQWAELTRKIGRAIAAGGSGADALKRPAVKVMIMQRARIAKKAAAKAPTVIATLCTHYTTGDHWLVYCDDIDQMDLVAAGLRDAGIDTLTYHSDMEADKKATLRHFRVNGGVVVSIKCLDEGVDIPECSHAMIAASSRNPREFIQRRGRVLRTSGTKTLAIIYDLIVLPAGEVDDTTRALVWGELARAGQFARSALNTDSRLLLEQACLDVGIDLAGLYAELDSGIEDDEEAEA
ncbi:MAG: DEAD-like helicase superfamily protein [Frankiales bacterium]|nr:DEAD-like helicase superfamily protein [Frankiales bacterium]